MPWRRKLTARANGRRDGGSLSLETHTFINDQ
jgi:hypothetical protein